MSGFITPPKGSEVLEASGVVAKDDSYYVIFDNVPRRPSAWWIADGFETLPEARSIDPRVRIPTRHTRKRKT